MTIDCGVCTSFVDNVERYFGRMIAQHGFTFVRCSDQRDGRECVMLYDNPRASLLFVRSDGSEGAALSQPGRAFPESGWSGHDTDDGWYDIAGLLEWRIGRKLLTQKDFDAFWRGTSSLLEWEAHHAENHFGQLIELFDPSKSQTWQGDYARYRAARHY